MWNNRWLGICVIAFFLSGSVNAAITSTTTHNLDPGDPHALDAQIVMDDIIAGMIPSLLPGDNGWHPANTYPAVSCRPSPMVPAR